MQMYDEISSTQCRPWVPQEAQDYGLRSPTVERNKEYKHFPVKKQWNVYQVTVFWLKIKEITIFLNFN